jgi:hypothetical protein
MERAARFRGARSAGTIEVRMTARCGWLLLGIAVGMHCLPGCYLLRQRADPCEVPADVATRKGEPGTVMGMAKTGDPAYPSALQNASRSDEQVGEDVQRVPLQPTVGLGPKETIGELVVDPPPTTDAPKLPEPPIKLAPFVQALQAILDDRHQDALKHLQAYDPETQEFYLRILPALTILARKRIDQLSLPEVAVLNAQLESLLVTLRPRTELVIERMCYCEWFKAYGIYQPLPDSHAFVAPSGDRPGEMVSLYVEVRNVASVPHDNYFETRLSSTIEIRDAKGQRVCPPLDFKDGEKPLRLRSRPHDHWNCYTFAVPPLPAGSYQLILHIADETGAGSRRVAHKALEFRVTPVGSRAN